MIIWKTHRVRDVERDNILNACHQELSGICVGLIQMAFGWKKKVFINVKSYYMI